MTFRFGYIFSSRSIRQKELSFEEVRKLISNYSLADCLFFLQEISRKHFLHTSQGGWRSENSDLKSFLSTYIPPSHLQYAEQAASEEGFVSPVSNHGLLSFAVLACSFCSREKVIAGTGNLQQELFSILLSIQGKLFSPVREGPEFPKIFPELNRHVFLELRLQRRWSHDMGRLHAFLTLPEVESKLKEKFPTASVDEFFRKGFSMDGKQFQLAANTTFGAIFYGADFSKLESAAPQLAKIILPLLRLVEISPVELEEKTGCITNFQELASKACLLLTRPAVFWKGTHFIPSFDALFNRTIRDLPYLSYDSRKSIPNPCSRWFGSMFEGYVGWLLKELFRQDGIELIAPYYTKVGTNETEKDILLRFGDIAIAFEIKSSVPDEELQLTGDWNSFVTHLENGTKQVSEAAEAVVQGRAFDSKKNPISSIKLVIPIVLTFETYPFRFPISREFEKRMEFKLKRSVFNKHRPGIVPVQYLDILQLEFIERVFDLQKETDALFEELKRRAYDEKIRHAPLQQLLDEKVSESPSIMDRFVEEAERISTQTLQDYHRSP